MTIDNKMATISFVSTVSLKPHPKNEAIYGANDEYESLVESIKEFGILQPLSVKQDMTIISGHRRWRAAIAAGRQTVPVIFVAYADELEENLALLHFNRQRVKNGLQIFNEGTELKKIIAIQAEMREKAGKKIDPVENLPQGTSDAQVKRAPATRDIIADKIGLGSGKQWDKLEYIGKHKPELLETISGENGKTVNQVFVSVRREQVREDIKTAVFPTGKYRVIYADPPWGYNNTMPASVSVQDDHYPTMPVDEICKLPVINLAMDNAVLFLWATSPILAEAFQVISAWGFEYKANFIWDKTKGIMGHYGNNVCHEHLLIAVRGSCHPEVDKLFDSVQSIERTEHSTKPEEFRRIIDTLYPHGTRIELFARKKVDGWESWGNQIPEMVSGNKDESDSQ